MSKIQNNSRVPSNSEVARLMRGNLRSPAEGCALKQIPPSSNTVSAFIQIPFGWYAVAKISYCAYRHLQFVSIVTLVSCIERSCGRQNGRTSLGAGTASGVKRSYGPNPKTKQKGTPQLKTNPLKN